jgi:hypothetical protein
MAKDQRKLEPNDPEWQYVLESYLRTFRDICVKIYYFFLQEFNNLLTLAISQVDSKYLILNEMNFHQDSAWSTSKAFHSFMCLFRLRNGCNSCSEHKITFKINEVISNSSDMDLGFYSEFGMSGKLTALTGSTCTFDMPWHWNGFPLFTCVSSNHNV